MTRLTILEYPDPRLRTRATPVATVDDSVRQLLDDMLETMYAAKGIGLAATQVNVHRRMLVVDVSEEKNAPLVFINPEILSREDAGTMQEGCLSVPGFFEDVERAHRARVRALGRDGKAFELDVEGLLAVCVQHEIDHLEGKLFVDYLSELKRTRIRKKLEKAQRRAQHRPRPFARRRRSDACRSRSSTPARRSSRCRRSRRWSPRATGCSPCYTQPDRPAGRGRALTAPPVKRRALELGLAVRQPATLSGRARRRRARRARPGGDRGRGLRPAAAAGGARSAAARLRQHPRLAAAALARRGAGAARDARR